MNKQRFSTPQISVPSGMFVTHDADEINKQCDYVIKTIRTSFRCDFLDPLLMSASESNDCSGDFSPQTSNTIEVGSFKTNPIFFFWNYRNKLWNY
jgi:hypothetical protein